VISPLYNYASAFLVCYKFSLYVDFKCNLKQTRQDKLSVIFGKLAMTGILTLYTLLMFRVMDTIFVSGRVNADVLSGVCASRHCLQTVNSSFMPMFYPHRSFFWSAKVLFDRFIIKLFWVPSSCQLWRFGSEYQSTYLRTWKLSRQPKQQRVYLSDIWLSELWAVISLHWSLLLQRQFHWGSKAMVPGKERKHHNVQRLEAEPSLFPPFIG